MTDGLVRGGFDHDLAKMQLHEASFGFLLMGRGVQLLEHKRDYGTVRTGNLFVEYAQQSGPSGLATTEAHHWAFEYDDDSWLVVPVPKLRRACAHAYKLGKTAQGGDYNRQSGVLLPAKWLVPPYPFTTEGDDDGN